MKEYELIEGESAPELSELVTAAITKGWAPQGGVEVVRYEYGELGESAWCFFQAVVRDNRP